MVNKMSHGEIEPESTFVILFFRAYCNFPYRLNFDASAGINGLMHDLMESQVRKQTERKSSYLWMENWREVWIVPFSINISLITQECLSYSTFMNH